MKKILFIGGGTGTSTILKNYQQFRCDSYQLSAIICMFDSGGSTGILRKEFEILPMGDIRQVMLSVSPDSVLKTLFGYRFDNTDSIKGHNLGNLIITALKEINGSEKNAFLQFSELLGVKDTIVPITWSNADIAVSYEDGANLVGEHEIDDLYKSESKYSRVKNVSLVPLSLISPEAAMLIKDADLIVIGPGDLYLSIICNFLVEGFHEALSSSHAKILYIANLVNKRGQTEDFSIGDYVKEVNKYLKVKSIDKVLVNTTPIPEGIMRKYEKYNAYAPQVDIGEEMLIETDLLSTIEVRKYKSDNLFRGFIRHDSSKVIQQVFAFLQDF